MAKSVAAILAAALLFGAGAATACDRHDGATATVPTTIASGAILPMTPLPTPAPESKTGG